MRVLLLLSIVTVLFLGASDVAVTPSGVVVAPEAALATEDGDEEGGWIGLVCDLCDCCDWFEGFF